MPEADWQHAGFGLYLHWPFCQSKCPYCDFNSHVAAQIDQNRWAEAYVQEIRRGAALTPNRRLDTVFFGGGTPSLMAPTTVQRILDEVRACWPLANDWEVTLEANPTSVESGRFAGYREAGVNRVSLGVQALNDVDLRRLGRLHSADEARKAFDIARGTFDRVSFDLIYARQDQSLDAWQEELGRALEMAIDHLSLYQLTIEPGTAFGARHAKGGLPGLPGEDLSADMYEQTIRTCADYGLRQYEISNFARPDSESKHNMLYWSGGDYLGIGPGAHGRLTRGGRREATIAPSDPTAWLRRVELGNDGCNIREPLSNADRISEYLLMGLRVQDGVSLRRVKALGPDRGFEGRVRALVEEGMLAIDDDRLFTTRRGRFLLNAVLVELLPE